MKKISGGKGTPLAFLAALLLLGMVVTLAGCGGGSALVGKWQVVKDGEASDETMEFFKDGTVIIEDSVKGEWKAEKGRLTITVWGMTQTADYKISGSTLTIIDDGDEEIYKKVKK